MAPAENTPAGVIAARQGASSSAETRSITTPYGPREVQIIGTLGSGFDIFDIQRGGHAEVYLCDAAGFNDPVALKSFPSAVTYDRTRRQAFLRECLLSLRLSSLPGFLGPTQIVAIEGRPYLMMPAAIPRVPGGAVTLGDLLSAGGLSFELAVAFAWSIADSLATAGETLPGVVHGDLKPQNIIMFGDVPMIADLGLARAEALVVGGDRLAPTPQYAAPELHSLETDVSVSTDVFAYGRVLQELLDATSGNARVNSDAATRVALAELADECTAIPSAGRPSSFRRLADRIEPHIRSEDPYVKHVIGVRELLAFSNTSLGVAFPHALVSSLDQLREWDLILETLDRPVELLDTYLRLMRARALDRLGRDDEALEWFNRALEVADDGPESWGIALEAAGTLTNAGRAAEAEELVRELIASAPSDTRAREAKVVLAMALLRQGRHGQARDAASTLLQGEASHETRAEGLLVLGWALEGEGRTDSARYAFQSAVTMSPSEPRFHRALAESQLRRLAYPLARESFLNAISCGSNRASDFVQYIACDLATSPPAAWEERQRDLTTRYGEELIEPLWSEAEHMARQLLDSKESGPTVSPPHGSEIVADAESAPVEFGSDWPAEDDFGDLIVTTNDVGYYTFDYYADFSDDSYLREAAARYLEVQHSLSSRVIRSSPIFLMICAGCNVGITTNRPIGSALLCRQCGVLNHAVPRLARGTLRLKESLLRILDQVPESAERCACVVALMPWDGYSEDEAAAVAVIALEHGLQPIGAEHTGLTMTWLRGVENRMYDVLSYPIGATYDFPPGSQRVPRLTPSAVEDYIMASRRRLKRPVNSSCAQFIKDDSLSSLLYSDELERMTEKALADPESGGILLMATYFWVARRDEATALTCGRRLIQRSPELPSSWVAYGYALLLSAEHARARDQALRALELDPAQPGAHALLAAIEALETDGESEATDILRAMSLGVLQLPVL